MSSSSEFWDWHVTVSFYVAVHLVNAHLSSFDLHYRKHRDVAHALNPNNKVSPTKLPEETFLAYQKLQNLSRRSRYLINENINQEDTSSHKTYDRHFKKAVRHLDTIMKFISEKYDVEFENIAIKCKEGVGGNFNFFTISNT